MFQQLMNGHTIAQANAQVDSKRLLADELSFMSS